MTKRRLEVLQLAAQGLTDTQIGKCLGIGRRSVNNYMSCLYEEWGLTRNECNQRVSAVTEAIRRGLVDIGT